MEYMGSLHRAPIVEPDNRHTPADNSDSSSRLNEELRPLLYTSAAPAARMQIITRPLSGVPTDASVKLTSRERSRLIIATILSFLFIVVLGFVFYVGSAVPELGLKTRDNVVTEVAPYDPGADMGVTPGDIVLSDIGSSTERTVIVAKATDPSTQITVTSNEAQVLTTFQRLSFVILALIFMGVGGPVYIKARHRVAASAFYAFCAATALCLIIVPLTSLGYGWAYLLMFLSLMAFSSCFALFFLKFPVRAGKTKRRHRFLVSSVYITGLITIGFYLLMFLFDLQLYAVARIVGFVYMAFCVLLGLASLGRALVRERSTEVRQQLVILLGGTALAVGPSLLLNLLPTLFFKVPTVQMDVTALTLGIMPVSFAYAITQGQLLGMRNFIRRGLVYVLMGFSVLLAFALAVAALTKLAPKDFLSDPVSLSAFVLFAFFIALSYGYVQKYVERFVDKYIYHDAYDYKEALLHFSAQLAAEQNLSTLADELVERTCRMMNLTCGVLLLASPIDKDANLQAELLLNDINLAGGAGESAWGTLRNAGHLNSGSDILAEDSRGAVNQSGKINRQQASGVEPDPMLRVVPYARYGDFADWLIEGLHYELSQLGIRLDQADGPMQLVYFNRQSGELDGNLHSGHLQTQPLREEIASNDHEISVTGTLHNNGRSGGSLNGYGVARSSMSDFATGEMNTGNLQPTRKLDIEGIRSFLGVPLWTRSRFVGVLCLGGKRTGERFTKDDLSLLSTLGSQAALAIFNAQLSEAREQALLDTIGALAHAIEAKDGYTIQHCENMTGRAVALAQAMGLPAKELENIRMGAILHDIGKIGIPDAVLNKPGKLTNEEYELMKQHAAIGARIVQSVGALQGVVPIIRYHQERYDGSGYPEGLKGEEIPIGARIIGVVDTYGAMTEDRVYRATPGHYKALDELQRLAGKQFDPTVVAAFISLLEEHPEFAEFRTLIA
jgi:putative nucleotidyltransferase with HDIG domain